MKAEFRTPIIIPKSKVELNHQSNIILMGSCFSNHIGEKLTQLKFNTLINPFGISYHPLAIHQQLRFQLNKTLGIEESNGVFFSYDFHSSMNTLSREIYHESIQQSFEKTIFFANKCDTLIITYGTAWVYELVENNKVVNNCHQQPAIKFNKRLLSQNEIVESWRETIAFLINQFNIKHIIFTISPVRHLKDGFHENQLSKAVLQLAVNEICKEHPSCSYFPSYEIMMDDLRDYRFYKEDFIHPNSLAVEYIWNKFEHLFFENKTIDLNKQIRKLSASVHHKAFQAKSRKHQLFLIQLKEKLIRLQKDTTIDFDEEIEQVSAQILS